MSDVASILADAAAADADAADWLTRTAAEIGAAGDPGEALGMAWAVATRRLGEQTLGADMPATHTRHGPVRISAWSRGDAGRVALALGAVAHPRFAPAMLVQLYRFGDEAERAALVRALSLLPDHPSLKALALEAGRVNSLKLFAALALDNPYPAAVYTAHEFNQMVLKALFSELPIARIVGLEHRADTELARMCRDYHDERVAAGRDVPRDIWLALAPGADETALKLLVQYLDGDDPDHRRFAALAVARRSGLPAFVTEALARAGIQRGR